jgi:hypothetical protein
MLLPVSQAQAQDAFAPATKWSDFLCIGKEICAVGDFNGDGFDDVMAFVRNTKTGVKQGDAWVALSNGTSFGPAQKWSDWICIGQEVCSVGDFNADGRDDVMAFVRDTQTGVGQGDAWVALSTGAGFAPAQKWSDWICIGLEVCAVGDFNADGRDDAVAFVRNTQNGGPRGDAWVALSTGTGFAPAQKWSDWMCIRQEVCGVGDFNADGRDDAVAFVRNTQTGAGQGDAWVGLSTGNGFVPASKWSDWICIGLEICGVGDFNGDRHDDAIAFVRDTQTGIGQGDAWVAVSTGVNFAPARKWSDWICIGLEICGVGDFNGDTFDDVVAFVRGTQSNPAWGDVWVALSAPIVE